MRLMSAALFFVVFSIQVFAQGMGQVLAEFDELVEKRETLLWFAAEQNQPLFKELVQGMDKDTVDYLGNNIYGSYRANILHNYKLKQLELQSKILNALLTSNEAVAELVAHAESAEDRYRPAYAELAKFVVKGLKFQAINDEKIAATLKQVVSVQTSLKADVDNFQLWNDYYAEVDKFDIPIWYYDDKNYQILYVTETPDSKWSRVNLNEATSQELAEVAGLTGEQADKIVAWREAGNKFENVNELTGVLEIDESAMDNIAPFVYVVTEQSGNKKKWTILVYICGSNDLERFGVSDVNEMETVGSDENVNIVVQLDRIDASEERYADFVEDGNWTGTRRYYVNKDNDPNHITSHLIEEMPNTDMGSPDELYKFIKFGADNYPAEKYLVVLWNHGAGWPGIAYDDESGKHLSVPQFTSVFKKAGEYLQETQNKKGIDIVNMDACLMAMVEVAHELNGVVDFMVGSEEVEPGAGMPYGDYLAPLKNYPDMSARAMARNMTYKFVKSYTTKGTQSSRYWGGSAVTQSAIEVGKVQPVVDAVDGFAKTMIANPQVWLNTLFGYFHGANGKRYSGDEFIDLYDFASHILYNVSEMQNGYPTEVLMAAKQIVDTMGVPDKIRRQTDQPVVLTHTKPGYIVWGVDGWKTPDMSTWVRGTGLFRSRFAITPLQKVEEGKYRVVLAPFARSKDRATKKPFFPTELNYRFVDENMRSMMIEKEGKAPRKENTIRRKGEFRITQHYKEHSPIVIEGHTQGMHGSYGMSIYLPLKQDAYNMTYNELKFAKETAWDEMLQMKPKFTRRNRVLLTDTILNLPSFVVQGFVQSLGQLGIKFDVMADASFYQGGYADVLDQYTEDGVVVMIGLDEKSLRTDDLDNYIAKGGKVVLISPFWIKERKYQDFFMKHLGATYGGLIERKLGEQQLPVVQLNGTENIRVNLDDAAYMTFDQTIYSELYETEKGEAFLKDMEGNAYGVAGKNMVYITLPFWQMNGQAQMSLLKESVERTK
jgi:DNA uptake protein ComE-like DNA-binding protein